jgi:hypothetical protein
VDAREAGNCENAGEDFLLAGSDHAPRDSPPVEKLFVEIVSEEFVREAVGRVFLVEEPPARGEGETLRVLGRGPSCPECS